MGSAGRLDIAVDGERADEALRLGRGDRILVREARQQVRRHPMENTGGART